ncbi:uncharacterized protein HKW66_Vig0112240 [Vigna angularis]|uniref:Disease resistance protein At4g27190-like leucine-rich repeats domain-containing protein n=1 Tax=Phaseolus angularis TaxID=3914 RepID=A0A8T0KYJ0_PHAAN|nr:uncharacterized protein HKW66_Vig0112240 [Vigna angularis]
MMDFVGPVLDIIIRLWDCCAHVRDYEENLSCLRDMASDLLGLWVDVSVKVQMAEDQHLRRLNEVNDWLVKVEAMQREVQAIQQRVAHAQETLAQEMPHAVVDEIPLEVTIVFSKLPWEDQFILPDLGEPEEAVLLKELECLEYLQDISIALFCFSSVQVLLNSPKLQRCIRHLRVLSPFTSTPHIILFSLLTKMQHLEVLSMSVSSPSSLDHVRKKGSPSSQCSITECIPMSSKLTEHGYIVGLRELSLEGCDMLNLNWLTRAQSLQLLRIYNCPSLEEVIGEEFGHSENVFSSLEIVDLDSLPKLRSICSQVLQFPCLKEICVADCPKLIKLPFDSNSARNSLKHINGQKSWWRKLQWEDEATRDHFASRYVPLRKIRKIR